MQIFTAYGLRIHSEMDLPELLPTQGAADGADVYIRLKTLEDVGPDWTQISPFVQVAGDRFDLTVPDVARFRVLGGTQIEIDPAPGIDMASVRVFLLGSALGALLFQRGLLLLHGNAIEVDGHCMVCLGPSGAGKSTLAAAFAKRGHRVLADDVVPIDADCAVVPGFPRIKLWQDAAEHLDVATEGLDRIRPTLNKFNLPVREQFQDTALPVRWVYLLSPRNEAGFELVPIGGLKRFPPLLANTYRRRFMEGMALRPDHLKRCGALAGKVHLARVHRPKSGFEIDGLVDHLLADMAEAG